MISKISKLLTATLLLAVNFNNSYASNMNLNNNNIVQNNYSYENNMNNILYDINQFYNAFNGRPAFVLNMYIQWVNSDSPRQLMLNLCIAIDALKSYNQQMVKIASDLYTQIKMLYNNVFANNYSNILSLFATWNFNMLNKLNNVFNLQPVKQYISQGRIRTSLNNEIDTIGQMLVNRIQQSEIDNPNQLYDKYLEVVNSIFCKYYERIAELKKTINNHFFIDNHFFNDNEQHRRNIVDMIKDNLIKSFTQREKYIDTLYYNVISDNYYNNIINSFQVQIQNALNQNNNINIDVHHNNADNVFHQILTNINQNHEVNANIKQFFDNYIGDKYEKVSNIFNINDNQELNDIMSILQNNTVKDYLEIGAIQGRLDVDLDKRRFFKGGVDDQGNDNNPADYDTFENHYLGYMKYFIDKYKSNITNIINNIDPNDNPIKQDIKNILNQCVNNREQYLNNKLQEINNNIGNTYQEYLNSYGVENNQ